MQNKAFSFSRVRSKQKHDYFGGAIALTTDHINAINGFSNQLFGWGGEDDEMLERCNILLGPFVIIYEIILNSFLNL